MKQTITFVIACVFLVSMVSMETFAQSNTVSGTVTDEAGQGLPGATVVVAGQSNGTITDVNGSYTLALPDGASELIFSFVGYEEQRVAIAGRSTIDVGMQISMSELNEVVVVGYGTQQKKDVSGAIVSVSSKDIERLPSSSFDQAIQGQVAGVNIQSAGGAPGAGVSINVRGVNSVNLSSEPIYVVDGMIVSASDIGAGMSAAGRNQGNMNVMATLNANDIESVTVLKDAASSAIYGARSGNGVVLITTKKGSKDGLRVNFDAYYGMSSLRNKIDMADSDLYNEYVVAKGGTAIEDGVSTDWQDELYTSGTANMQNISVSGGSENVSVFMSANHYQEDGIVMNTGLERFGLRANVAYNKGIFTMGNNLYLSTTNIDRMAHLNASPISEALNMPPVVGVHDAANVGGFSGAVNGLTIYNPVGVQTLQSAPNTRNRVMGNTYAELEIISGLKFRTNVGYDYTTGKSRILSPYWESPASYAQAAFTDDLAANSSSWLLENTLSYTNTLGDHKIDVLVGTSQQRNQAQFATVTGSPVDNTTPYGITTVSNAGIRDDVRTIASLFGRAVYTFKGRYVIQGVLRRDAISSFNEGYKWGTFPSVSAAWNIIDESFMSGASFLSDLKLRASYGSTGNAGIGSYDAQNPLAVYARYPFGSSVYNGVAPGGRRTDEAVTWETVEEQNIGLDIGVLDGKLSLGIDYYSKTTTDLLLQGSVPSTTGFSSFTTNNGEMTNSGFDFALVYKEKIGDLDLRFNANLGTINNEVTALLNDADVYYTQTWGGINQGSIRLAREGEQVGSFYGYVFDGIQQEGEADPGNVRFKDLDGVDGIDNNDQTILGSPVPDYIYGFGVTAEYKGFDFSLNFYGMSGNEIYSTPKHSQIGFNRLDNIGAAAQNAWTAENPSEDLTRFDVFDNAISSRWVEDGSFMRLQNVQLGYTMNDLFGGSISSLRLYVSGRNLLVLSAYNDWGYDPEVGNSGIDYVTYPQPSSVFFGVNVGF